MKERVHCISNHTNTHTHTELELPEVVLVLMDPSLALVLSAWVAVGGVLVLGTLRLFEWLRLLEDSTGASVSCCRVLRV